LIYKTDYINIAKHDSEVLSLNDVNNKYKNKSYAKKIQKQT